MALPESPVDMTGYNTTLNDYNASAVEFDQSMSERDVAYAALVAAQQAYDSADASAIAAAADAGDKLTLHIGAASEVGVTPGVTPALKRR